MTAIKLQRRHTSIEPWSTEIIVDGNRLQLSIEAVGPLEATKMLGHNTHNRNVKDRNVDRFATDMVNGDWLFDGSPLRFSNSGVLLDGQNRLLAVVASGATANFLIIRGLPDVTQDVMDTGAVRTFADVLKLKGEANNVALSAVVRSVAAWEDGARRNLSQWKASHKTLERTLQAHPELRDYVNEPRRVAKLFGVNPSALAMLWWVFDRIDQVDSAAFFERLESGQGPTDKDPVRRLHRTLLEETKTRGGNANTQRQVVFVIKAWNAYREGREVGLYRWSPGGASPEKFPEPV